MKLDIIYAGAQRPEQTELILQLLGPLGVDSHGVTEAEHDRRRMENALILALRRSEIILLVGGLGSGDSDFTTPLLCDGLGLREEVCPPALENLKNRYKAEAEALSKGDLVKVKIPAGAYPFLNRWGDCPGYALAAEDQCIAVLPNGAAEFADMAQEKLLPYLEKVFSPQSQPVEGGVFGISAEQVNQRLAPAKELAKIVVKKEGIGVSVRFLPEGEKNHTETAAGLAQNAMEGRFFTGASSTVAAFVKTATENDVTVAAAEKEGSGEVRRLLAQAPAVGGEVPSLDVSRKIAKSTGIPKKYFRKKKGVSIPLAVHMARSARERYDTTLGIGMTGFRSAGHRRDMAWVALCDSDKAWVAKILVPEERLNLDKELAATAALDMARRYAKGDSSFLSGGTALPQAQSGKKVTPSLCTLGADGTALWQEPGEKIAMPVKHKRGTPRPALTAGGFFLRVILFILLAAILLTAGAVGSFWLQAHRAGQLAVTAQTLYLDDTAAVPDGYPADYDTRFAALWSRNQDIVAWLSVPRQNVAFPVVQSPDSTFYAIRNFDREPSLYGTTYLAPGASLAEDSNLTLFGNNMADGQMFAHLENYRSLTYYRENPVLSFETVYGGVSSNYKVCAVFVIDPDETMAFDYQTLKTPADSQAWQDLIADIEARSLICTPVDLREGDHLLTLSTPVEDFDGARLIVMARRTRSGEVKSVSTDDAVYHASPLLPAVLMTETEQFYEPELGLPAESEEGPENEPAADSSSKEESVPDESEPEESSSSSAADSSSSQSSSSKPSSSSQSSSSKPSSSSQSSSSKPSSSSQSSSSKPSSSSQSSSSKPSSSSQSSSSKPSSSSQSSSSKPISSSQSSSSQDADASLGLEIPVDSSSSKPASSSSKPASSSSKPASSSSKPASSSSKPVSSSSKPDGASGSVSGGETFIVNGKEYDAYDAVCRVVAAELGNGSYEAIKAQAVATYTLLSRNNVTGAYLTTPSSTVKQAVAEVWGEALYVGSRKMTQVFYFAISNGRTQGPEDVWGGSVAGYGSVDSSWDANVTSAYERTVRMSKEKVISRCQEYLGIDLTDVPVEDWFTVESYTEGGYNGEMTVGGYSKVQKSGSSAFRTGAKITGRILRESVLNLRSACFTWEEDGDDILFTTRGYGHGVGMSQWGAIEMSKMGYDYVEILEHYYPGATVK